MSAVCAQPPTSTFGTSAAFVPSSHRLHEQLVHAFVTSRLDMGNALLSGITQAQLSRLQRFQNCAARLVTRTNRAEHIAPVLEQFHWLPVKQGVIFKILLQVYLS